MTDKINYIFNNGINALFSSESTVITQSSTSGSDLSSNLNDNNFDTISKTEKGLGEFIDLSFNNPIDVSNLESLVIYTNNQISNPIVSKIRYETIGNVALDISEIQVWRDNSNIINPLSTVGTTYQFNKVKYINLNNGGIHISEIQIWINGTNVAPSATVTSSGDGTYSGWGGKEKINDEQHLDGSQGWHSDNNRPAFIQLELSTKYSIQDLESVVVYNRSANPAAAVGSSLQLIDDSTLNYSGQITVGVMRYRYDGPAIVNVASFANGNSTTQIISSSGANVTVIKEPDLTIQVSSNANTKNNLVDNDISTSYESTQNLGQYIDLNISSTNLNDLQAIVIYNNTGSVNDLSNQKLTKLSLFDDSNVAIFEISNNATSQTDSSYNIIRYDGPKQDYYKKRIKNIKLQTNKHSFLDVNELQVWVDGTNIATSNTITQSSLLGSDISNNVIDSNLSTKSGTTRGLGEFFNVELSEPIDPESLESVVVYSDIDTSKNHFVKKLRFETTENYPLELNELQVWVGNSNLLQKNNFIYSWDFRVASSSSINDSKGGLTATYNGGMSSSINDGATLDGTNDYISIPSFQLGGDPFTIETYFKLNSVKGFGRIFQFGHSNYDRLSLYRSFSTNNFGFNIKNGTTQVTYSGSGSITLSLNIWYHMVIVSNDTNLKVYINNVQAQESILSTTISRLSRIEHTLGANVLNGSPQEFNDMDMKLFRVWDGYALSSSEINLLYNNRESIQSDFPSNSYQSSTIYDLSYSYDNSFNTYASTSSGTGQFFDISFNGFDFNDLQAIVTYNYNTNFHNFYKNKIILYDDSDVPFIEYRNNNITSPNQNSPNPTYNWDFRVASSTSITDSVGGLTATYMNGLTSSVTNGAYFAGGGVSSGEYNYIDLQDFELGTTLSVELYANFEDTQSWSKLFEFGDSSPSDTSLVNSIRFTRGGNGTSLMALTHNSSGSETERVTGGTIVNGAWTHLVLTISGGNINVYQDGSSIGTGSTAVVTQKTRVNHFIGRSLHNNDNYFKGYMRYFRIWEGTALTQSQVTDIYNDREILNSNYNIFKFKGPNHDSSIPKFQKVRLETTDYSYFNLNELQVWIDNSNIAPQNNNISYSSGTTNSTNLNDANLTTYALTEKGLGQFVELSLDQSYDVSSLQAVVAYSDNLGNVNSLISKFRIETTVESKLDISEIQVWYDHSNVAQVANSLSSMTDDSITTNYTSSIGKGQYIDVSFTPFNYDNLQAIVIYNNARSSLITPYYTFDASSYNFNGSGTNNTVAGLMIDMPGFVHLTGNSPKTIEAYVSTTDTDPQFVVQLGEIANNKSFALRTMSGKLSFMGFYNDVNSDISINDGNIHRVAISYDGNVTLKFFSDNTVETKTLSQQLNTGSTDAKVGATSHSNRHYWNGTIGKVNIYNTFISSLDEVGENEINDLSDVKFTFYDDSNIELFTVDSSASSSLKTFSNNVSTFNDVNIYKYKGKEYSSSISKISKIRFVTTGDNMLSINEAQLWVGSPITTWSSTSYSQLGQTLTGNAGNDRIFSTMGMSSDGLKLVSANQLDPTTDSRGTIQAYSFNGNTWVTYGSLIEAQRSQVGESAYSSIADMTDDGTRIFVGWKPNPSPNTRGFAQVYDFVNGDWSQVGDNILGDNTDDQATRIGVISGDGTTIAHMGGYTNTASTRYCQVRRYQSSTNTWNQIGSNIAVGLTNKNADKTDCLAISQNGNIVAIGSNKDGTSSQGAVRIYQYNSSTNSWSQLGSTLLGENANDEFGISLSMSDDGTVIIVGSWKADDTGGNDGNARVFEYSNNSWTQVGNNIIPNTSDNDPVYFGNTVRVSGNGKFFAVSGYQSKNPAGQNQSGETRVYIREGNTFTQIINTIYGDHGDFFGSQIFLNTDGTILAVGSGGFNGADLHPMKLYQLTHSYNNSYSSTNVLSDSNNIVTQSSTLGSDVSSQVNDTNFGTVARTERRNGEFIDISLNSLYDVSNLQGLVVYSSINNDTNPTISKIRYQTTSNVQLKIGEFQVWVDNSNIASQINNVASSTSGTQVIGNLNDSDLYTYASTNQGEGEYFDISLNNSFNYNDLEAIVTYTDETAGDLINQRSTKLILYDESNTPVIELSNNLMESGYVVNNSYTGPMPKYSFDFRNGSTITNDQISNVVATAYNGVTFNSNGASLNGSNQYIESTSSMSISGEVSFEFYIQFTPQGTSDPGVIYVISDDNDGLSILNVNQSYTETPQGYKGNTNAHQLNMVLSNAQGVGSDSFDPRFNNMSNLINSGTMTHVVITFDSAGFRTYKNGSLHQTQGSTAANVSSKLRKLRLGVGTNSVYSLMTIKYIRIYDNALTTSQASTMYSLRESTNLTVPGMVSLTTPYKIFKYVGPSHKLDRSKLSHFKIETTKYSQLNINEIQYFTDGNNLFQTDKPVLTSTTTFGNNSLRVARIRRATDNVEADFYNVNNEGLKTIDGTTISSWMSSLPTPTYNWDFRVSSSTINNDSISGLTATYMNGLTSTVQNGAYFPGGGASNGNFNYIDLQDFNSGGTCSFEAYVRFEGNGHYERIFDFGNGAGAYNILVAREGSNSNLQYYVKENSDSNINGGTIVNGQFTHIVATINSTDNNIKLYQDGSLVGSLSTTNIPTERTRTNNYLGRSNWGSDQMFNGYIKYFRIWQGTELSSSDVTNLYNARETANNFVGFLTKLYSQSSTTTTDLVQPTTSKQPKITLSSLEMIFSGGQDIYAETPTNMLNTNQDYFSFAFTFNHQSESNHGEMGFWPTVGTYNQGGSVSINGPIISGNRTYIGFEGYDNGTYGTSGTIVDINTEYNFIMTVNNSVSNNILTWANNSTTTPTKTAASSGNGGNNTTHSLNPNNFYLGSRRSTGVFYIGTLKSFIVLNKTLSTTEAASFNSTSNYTSNNTPWIDSNNLNSSATGIFSLYNLRTDSESSKLFDSNLSTYLITEKGLGQSFDLSFNTAQDLSKIDGIVFYSDVRNDYNPLINKVRIETIDNVKLYYNEIQIWTGTTNILNTISTSNVSSSSSTDLSNLYDQSLGSYYESNQGVGEYIDFVLNNSYYLNDIKSIITYSKNSSLQTLQDLKNIKLTLFDDSNVPFIELSGNEITTSNDLINSIGDPTYYWDFRVASSTSITDSVGGLTATYNGGMSSTISDGASFDGNNDYISLTNFQLGSTFTIETYHKFASGGTPYGTVFAFGDLLGGGHTNWISLDIANNGPTYRYGQKNGASAAGDMSPQVGNIVFGEYQHMVIAVSPTELNFYENGTLIQTRTTGVSAIVDKIRNYHRLGMNTATNTEYFEGNIKYFRVWNGTALPISEVTNLYENREVTSFSLIVKYNGPNYETNIQKLKSVKFETTVDSRMNFNEIQLWSSTSQYNLFERFRSIDAQYGTLTATRSVTMPINYNGNLMNFPQSIFNGAMGSNTRTVSGLTGDLSIFNGTYSITWSSNHTVPYSNNPAHYMFSATNSTNQYGDGNTVQFRYPNNNVPYNSSGNYTGSNYLTYYDDNGNAINASGEWFAFEFPAYINFTKVHHIALDGHVNTFTWIGRDSTGTNRLLRTYSMSWNNGYWRSKTFNNNYYVNKIYLVITKKQSGLEYLTVKEIFFDGNYEISPAQNLYPNNTTVATTTSVSVNDVSNMFDRSFNTNFSFDKGLGNFVDISLNDPIDLSSVQSIVAYSSINNTHNPIISKIRYETTANVALEANEIQVWRDNSNIIPSPSVTLNYTGSETLLTYTNLHSSMTGVFSVKFGADGIVYGVTGKQLYKNIFTTPSLIYTWGQDWYFNDFNVDKYGNVYIGDSNPGYRGLSKLTYNSASDSYSSPVTLHDNHPNPGYYGSYSVYYIGYEATARIYYEHPLIYLVASTKNISSYNVDTNTTVHQRNYGEPNNGSLRQQGRLSGLAHDSQGNIFVSNWENGSVVLVYKAGTIFGSSVDYDGNPWIVDNLYTITGSNHLGSSTTRNSSPDFFTQDGQHVKFSTHYYCAGLMIDSNDDMYFTSYRDNYRMVLVKVSGATGIATRLVGDGNHSGGLSWTDGAQINQLYSRWTRRHQYYGPFFTIDSQDTLWLKNGTLLFTVPRSIIPSVSSTSGSNLSYLYDANLNTYFNTNQGIGEYIDLNLRSTNFNDIQSIIVYNNGDSGNDLSNQNATKLILYDDNNLPVVEYINNVQSGSYKYFKYKGPAGYDEDVLIPKIQNIRIDTTEYVPLLINELQLWVSGNNVIPTQGIITQSSTYSSDVSSNISDSNLDTYARTDRGLGEYIDVSFSDPIPIQDVESLVLYSNNTNYNPLLNKIRFITNDNVKIELDKVQLWTDYSNILQETNYLSNQGIGEYIDISTNLVRYDDIQEIIAYVGNSNVDLSNFDKTKLQFYDSSNILFAEINNFSGQAYSGTYDWDFRISTPSISHTPLITPTYNWDFRVASSTSVTDSVGGLTATYEGGATSDTTNGVLLDGVNDFIDLDNFEFGGVCSWEVYFKFETRKNQTAVVQFSHTGYTSFSENDLFLFYTTSTNYYNMIRNNGSNTAVWGNQAMGNTDTNWNHVIWTFNNGTHVQYLNGVKKLEITGIPMRTITRNHHILGNYFDTVYMHGYIKYFRVYQGTALTQSQVTELYNTRDGVISITDSVGGLSATYMNGTTSDTTNGALFDGINNYIELDDFEFGGVCSFEVYYKFITQKNGNVVVQFSDTGRTTATENDLMMLQGGTTNYYNSIRNNGSNTSVWGNGAMGTTNTNWNHVVWTFNNGTHKQYLNGVEKLTTTGVPMRTIIRAHHMLGNKYDSVYMNGYIKYFRIYQDLELDANTVTNLFNNRESSQPNLLIKNIRKYKGNSSSTRQLSKVRIESLDDNQLNIEELQLWVNNENHLYTPTHSTFILTGDTRSLTDVHGTSVLTLINSPTFDTNGVTPSDNTKYITIPTSLTNFGSNDFTISFWYEPLSDVTGYNHIFSMPWNSITGDFLISQISTTREFLLVQRTTSNINHNLGIISTANTLYNFIITRKNNFIKVFINGEEKTSVSYNGSLNNRTFMLGASSTSPNASGFLNASRIFKRLDIWNGTGFSN